MKKKMGLLFAGLGLCASMMMFNANEAKAEKQKEPCPWEPGTYCEIVGMDCENAGNSCLLITR